MLFYLVDYNNIHIIIIIVIMIIIIIFVFVHFVLLPESQLM